jgi:hypothetical protein
MCPIEIIAILLLPDHWLALANNSSPGVAIAEVFAIEATRG